MKRDRSELWLAALNVCGLAGALVALAVGASAHGLRAVAAFCGVGVAAALYAEIGRALTRRRARAQSAAPVPRNVWLRKPLWISAIDGASFLTLATPLAAVAGGLGFASVGAGMVMTIAAFMALGFVLGGIIGARALALEDDGLRVQIRGATFLVRWDAIVDVTRAGHAGQLLRVSFTGPAGVVAAVAPATARARARVKLTIGAGGSPTATLSLSPWAAGLDGAVLARALGSARAPASDRAN